MQLLPPIWLAAITSTSQDVKSCIATTIFEGKIYDSLRRQHDQNGTCSPHVANIAFDELSYGACLASVVRHPTTVNKKLFVARGVRILRCPQIDHFLFFVFCRKGRIATGKQASTAFVWREHHGDSLQISNITTGIHQIARVPDETILNAFFRKSETNLFFCVHQSIF